MLGSWASSKLKVKGRKVASARECLPKEWLRVPSRTKVCKPGTIEDDVALVCYKFISICMCCLDPTIGAFPGAKLGQQMRLDSISAAVPAVGLQGRAKDFSNVWLFE